MKTTREWIDEIANKFRDEVKPEVLEGCKSYKDCQMLPVGGSDIATLVLVGCKGDEGAFTELLNMGSDGSYQAYIALESTAIPEHYKKVASFNQWVRIYDDTTRTAQFSAQEINIYRAGDFGIIIQLIEPMLETARWINKIYGYSEEN